MSVSVKVAYAVLVAGIFWFAFHYLTAMANVLANVVR
jgi:hypothetical protein